MRDRLPLKYHLRKIHGWFTLRRVAIVLRWGAAVLLAVVACVVFYCHLAYATCTPPHLMQIFVKEFYSNASMEIVSILFTIFVIDELYRRRARQDEKRRLILQMGSPNHEFAIEAVRILGLEGWLADGSLKKADLYKANLQEAELFGANLQGANLREANLKRARLWRANLQKAVLWEAKLQGAELIGAELQEADLVGAKLQGADLAGAYLQGANLHGAILRGANLREAKFDEKTTLPDPDAAWTPDTDMRRFTGLEHPDF